MHVNAHLDVDLVALEGEDEVTVLLELQAPEVPGTQERAGQTLIVVLDRSGSMSGGPLEGAKQALRRIVSRLSPKDTVGVVVFDDTAEIAVPAKTMADHDTAELLAQINRIQTGGMTDLSSGYLLGVREARRTKRDTGATLLLISDGHANAGIVDANALGGTAQKFSRDGVTTVTLGYGIGYDEVLLEALARNGNGAHRFAQNVDEVLSGIAEELEGLLDKSVVNAQLRIMPKVTDNVDSIGVLQPFPTWAEDGGVVVSLGDLWAGEERKVLIRLGVPAMPALGLAVIADLVLVYNALPSMAEHTVTLPIAVNVVPGDETAGRIPNPKVQVERLIQEAQTAKIEASSDLREGKLTEATGGLKAAAAKLRESASRVSVKSPQDAERLAEARQEADELERLADEAEGVGGPTAAKANMASYSQRSRTRSPRRSPSEDESDITRTA